MSALISLFSSFNAPASRLTPQLFLFYLRVFKTARAPKLMVSEPEQLCCSDASWEPIIGLVDGFVWSFMNVRTLVFIVLCICLCVEAVPLKCAELVRFGLKAQRFSSSVYADVSLKLLFLFFYCTLNKRLYKQLWRTPSKKPKQTKCSYFIWIFLKLWFKSLTLIQSLCWTSLLEIVNSSHDSSAAVPAPSPQFLHVFIQHIFSWIISFFSYLL